MLLDIDTNAYPGIPAHTTDTNASFSTLSLLRLSRAVEGRAMHRARRAGLSHLRSHLRCGTRV